MKGDGAPLPHVRGFDPAVAAMLVTRLIIWWARR
jgi:hypothetical protein